MRKRFYVGHTYGGRYDVEDRLNPNSPWGIRFNMTRAEARMFANKINKRRKYNLSFWDKLMGRDEVYRKLKHRK